MWTMLLVIPAVTGYGAFNSLAPVVILNVVEGIAQALMYPSSAAAVAKAAPVGRASAAQGLGWSIRLAHVNASCIHHTIAVRMVRITRRIRRSGITDERSYRFSRTDVVATEPARTIGLDQLKRSTIMAIPWPPPTHMDSMPTVLSCCSAIR